MAIKEAERRNLEAFLARKQYDRAIELLERLNKASPDDVSLKMRLADTYYLYGKTPQAVNILKEVAELYASLGFVTKAMAVQKKIERFDPKAGLDIRAQVQEAQEAQPTDTIRRKAAKREHLRMAAENAAFSILDQMFSGLSKDEFDDVFAVLKERNFSLGDVVFNEFDESKSLYIIISGSVKVVTHHRGKDLELAVLKEGDFFGEVALLSGKRRTATVIAVEESHMLILERVEFLKLGTRYPKLKETLHEAVEKRAQSTIQSILSADIDTT